MNQVVPIIIYQFAQEIKPLEIEKQTRDDTLRDVIKFCEKNGWIPEYRFFHVLNQLMIGNNPHTHRGHNIVLELCDYLEIMYPTITFDLIRGHLNLSRERRVEYKDQIKPLGLGACAFKRRYLFHLVRGRYKGLKAMVRTPPKGNTKEATLIVDGVGLVKINTNIRVVYVD